MKKVGMISLGCAKNRVDSETMLGMLRARGFEIVGDPAEADLLFVTPAASSRARRRSPSTPYSNWPNIARTA